MSTAQRETPKQAIPKPLRNIRENRGRALRFGGQHQNLSRFEYHATHIIDDCWQVYWPGEDHAEEYSEDDLKAVLDKFPIVEVVGENDLPDRVKP